MTGNVFTDHTISYYDTGTPISFSDVMVVFGTYKDKEGITFQDANGCRVANNTISSPVINYPNDDQHRTRCIYFYMNNTEIENSNNVVENNSCVGQFIPAIYFSGPGSKYQSNWIINNLIDSSGVSGNASSTCFQINTSNDNAKLGTNYFMNNTCVSDGVNIGLGLNSAYAGKWVFRNNIIKSSAIILLGFYNSSGDMTFQNNIYYPNDTASSIPYSPILTEGGGTSPRDFAAWQSLGFDTGSSEGDPLFENEAADDYQLQPGSIAIDAGKWSGLISDKLGNARSGMPDIGALERQ